MAKSKETPRKVKNAIHPIVWVMIPILTMLFISSVVFLYRFRREINNTELLRSYRIQREAETEQEAELLKNLCQNRLSSKLYSATSASHLYLHLADAKETVENLGFSLDGVQEHGFIIARQGNGLFLLAPDKTGLSRACYYLVYRMTAADGTLLLGQDQRHLDTGRSIRSLTGPNNTPLSQYNIGVCKTPQTA